MMNRTNGMTHAQRARFARTDLYGHRAVKRTAAWIALLVRIAKGGTR